MEQRCQDELREYLEAYSGDARYPTMLVDFMQKRFESKRLTDLMPMDEYELRRSAIAKIAEEQGIHGQRQGKITVTQYMYLWQFPLSDLLNPQPAFYYTHHLKHIHMTVDHFYGKTQIKKGSNTPRKRHSDAHDPIRPSPRDDKGKEIQLDPVPQPDDDAKRRNAAEAEECRKFDHFRCVITGAASPHACHIIPFVWNDRSENLEVAKQVLQTLETLFPRNETVKVQLKALLTKETGVSDKSWNMICLSPTLHVWWTKGYFVLKYLGAKLCEDDPTKCVITIQFRTTPFCPDEAPEPITKAKRNKGARDVDFDEEKDVEKGIFSRLDHDYGCAPLSDCDRDCERCQNTKAVKSHHVHSGRPILSGTTFTVIRYTDDLDKFKLMMDLQESISRIASMAGGAGDPEPLFWPDEDDEFGSGADKRLREHGEGSALGDEEV